jgi:hypothetical protein
VAGKTHILHVNLTEDEYIAYTKSHVKTASMETPSRDRWKEKGQQRRYSMRESNVKNEQYGIVERAIELEDTF